MNNKIYWISNGNQLVDPGDQIEASKSSLYKHFAKYIKKEKQTDLPSTPRMIEYVRYREAIKRAREAFRKRQMEELKEYEFMCERFMQDMVGDQREHIQIHGNVNPCEHCQERSCMNCQIYRP